MAEPSPPSTPTSLSSGSSRSPSISSPSTPPNLHQNSIDPATRWLVQKFGGTSVGKFAVKIAEDIVSYVSSFYITCVPSLCWNNSHANTFISHFARTQCLYPLYQISLTCLSRGYIDQHKVAIVCSARSGSTKALGTTNLLLKAASEALQRTRSPLDTSGTNTPNGLFSRLSMSSLPASPRPRSKSSPRSDSPFGAFAMNSVHSDTPSFNSTVDLIRSEHLTAARCSVRDPELLKELEAEIEHDCDSLRSFLFAAQVGIYQRPCKKKSSIYVNLRSSMKFRLDQKTASSASVRSSVAK